MESGLYFSRPIVRETPHILTPDLVAQLNIGEFFKEQKKRSQNKPMPVSFGEIIVRESGVKMQNFRLSEQQKQAFV